MSRSQSNCLNLKNNSVKTADVADKNIHRELGDDATRQRKRRISF